MLTLSDHFVNIVISSTQCHEVLPSIIVPSIHQHYLLYFIIQLMNQPLPHNVQVRIHSTKKYSIPPNNPPNLQAHPHLVAHPRPLKLVRIPHWIKCTWLLNVKVSTIKTYKSVFPFYLLHYIECGCCWTFNQIS